MKLFIRFAPAKGVVAYGLELLMAFFTIALIDELFVTVLLFIMIMSVYGRFFHSYLYTAIAPIHHSTFAEEASWNVSKSIIKSYATVCLE